MSVIEPQRAVQPRPAVESVPDGAWLHICNGLSPRRDGGMVPSILGLTAALARSEGARPLTIVTPTLSDPEVVTGRSVALLGPEPDLEACVRRAEVLHLHGLWQGHTRRGAREARRRLVPYLVAAHGMAEPWALKHKALKKKVYTALVESRNLRQAACLHALSRPEIGHLRSIAPSTPVALIPNGVDLAPFDCLPPRSVLEAEFPELAGKFLLLFLARLHVKKGLDLLAQAMEALAADHPELHLLLAGTDDGAKTPFLDQMQAAGLADRVTVLGHVGGERARVVWGAADAFVLPSYSEGFSMAVLEALAARRPALITTACHFPELAAADGGIVVQPDRDGVTAGLRDLLERTAAERATLAARGRALVEARYSWDKQAERLAAVYRWLAGGGVRPEAVGEADG